eukprot:6180818-Pleurochrysis_carterae.AAC.1
MEFGYVSIEYARVSVHARDSAFTQNVGCRCGSASCQVSMEFWFWQVSMEFGQVSMEFGYVSMEFGYVSMEFWQ